jgi:hypothetical protein
VTNPHRLKPAPRYTLALTALSANDILI